MVDSKNDPQSAPTTRKQREVPELAVAKADQPPEQSHPNKHLSLPSNASLPALLAELRRDVQGLIEERKSEPTSAPAHDDELRQLLTDLHQDVETLKYGRRVRNPRDKDQELNRMIADLRGEINALQGMVATISSQDAPLPTSKSLVTQPQPVVIPSSNSAPMKIGIPVGILVGLAASLAFLVFSGDIAIGPRGITLTNQFEKGSTSTTVPLASPEQLIETASTLSKKGDITFARRVLTNAVAQGSALAALMLARTYDPQYLAQMYNPGGVMPEVALARLYYQIAARGGVDEAVKRLSELSKAPE